MSRLKEIAKFACGWEAFHALAHAYFWYSDITLTLFGISATPTMSLGGAVLASVLAILLGIYAWGSRRGLERKEV